jgi:hypothetical protein
VAGQKKIAGCNQENRDGDAALQSADSLASIKVKRDQGGQKNQGPSVGRPLFHEFNSPPRRRVAPKVAHDLATRGEVSSLKLVWHNHNDASTNVECVHSRVVKKLSIFCQINRRGFVLNRCHTSVPLAVREDTAYAEGTLKGPG